MQVFLGGFQDRLRGDGADLFSVMLVIIQPQLETFNGQDGVGNARVGFQRERQPPDQVGLRIIQFLIRDRFADIALDLIPDQPDRLIQVLGVEPGGKFPRSAVCPGVDAAGGMIGQP